MNNSPTGLALSYLAGICNYARTEDGAGFSKHDAETGHDLARKYMRYGSWASAKQLTFAQKMCHKYRRQLDEGGFSLAEIKAEIYEGAVREAKPETADVVILAAIVGHTAKALRINGVTNDRLAWVPKSQIKAQEPGEVFGTFMFTLPAWIAADKGLVA